MRLKKLIKSLSIKKRFPYLINDLTNIKYLTGFTGSFAALLVDKNKSFFITDSRYSEYAKSILPEHIEFILREKELIKVLRKIIKKNKYKKIYIEGHSTTISQYFEFKKKLKKIRIIPSGSEVNLIRMIKNETEIKLIKKAAAITDRCVTHLKNFIKTGMTEWDVAVEIDYFYKKNGCTKTSFDSIVASGKGSSMPHYETSMDKKIESGDIVLIDMGCIYKGYNSDLTRIFFINSIAPEVKKIYNIVKKAQQASIDRVKSGILTGTVDKTGRDIITKAGYGKMFSHSMGHGFGLEVHEFPAVKKDGKDRLKQNMMITIEPGIYIPGLGGIRIEDMVMVTSKGVEVLTKSSKEIIIL